MTFAALVLDTFREAMARRIFWGLFGMSLLLILFFLLVMRIDVVEGSLATMSLFGMERSQTLDLDRMMKGVQGAISTFLYTFAMFVSVFASAGLIPSVLEPGRIELLLSKPVSRVEILLGRFTGNVLVVAANATFLVFGIWLILGVKTGLWPVGFLVSIPSTVFVFSVLLTVVIWAGVLWESTAVSTMIPVVLMVMSPILAQNRTAERLLSSQWSRDVWNGLYYALPKVFDIGRMTLEHVRGNAAGSWMPVWSSAMFAIVVLGWSLWIFEKRDF